MSLVRKFHTAFQSRIKIGSFDSPSLIKALFCFLLYLPGISKASKDDLEDPAFFVSVILLKGE